MHANTNLLVNTLRGAFILGALALILSPLPAEFALAAHAKPTPHSKAEPMQHQQLRLARFKLTENQHLASHQAQARAPGKVTDHTANHTDHNQTAKKDTANSSVSDSRSEPLKSAHSKSKPLSSKPRASKQPTPAQAHEAKVHQTPEGETFTNNPLASQTRSGRNVETTHLASKEASKEVFKEVSKEASKAVTQLDTQVDSQTTSASSEQNALGRPHAEPQPLVRKPLFATPPTPPTYPSMARRRGVEGTVVIEVSLDALGSQTHLKIQKSSGNPLLDNSAVNAVREWRFLPHQVKGLAIASRVHIPVRFELN
ncbi:hypothetical protein A3742_08155 [Oleiphilus sp. HI0071]|nr:MULTISPECIES: energy transducer TonB [unclassified Oleiphilus]KZY72576.1 hypothetical protein A3737_10740 [Oleiphilus sp. HI0065]KZY82844.1 hypothetical protein A3742_08155 [Oleiphilus sp. HI0071]KZZ04843.1 hypothetical protein A3744_09215 [Oleiphilus sp. HI0073]KZZ49150.1 hypothetical protein A3760_02860 [Oleiphilus sp. HI0122]KZZ13031.1 hypothetical protein A3750_04620 [Oleiphilus sp. HI0079]